MLKTLLEHNAGYYAIISNLKQRPWGRIFYNPDNAEHIDSNHAEGFNTPPGKITHILDEVEEFYRQHGLLSQVRVNQFDPPGIEAELLRRGYTVRPASYRIMLWDNIPSQPVMRPGITVERVGAHNRAEALHILSGEKSWGSPEILAHVFKREFDHTDVQYYLARKGGVPAAVGFLFYQGALARVENIRTAPTHRGNGCAAALIRHMQSEFTARGGRGLYLLAGDAVMGLYHKCGFVDMGEIQEINAFLPN